MFPEDRWKVRELYQKSYGISPVLMGPTPGTAAIQIIHAEKL
jgi:hypothetical protein